MKTKITLIMSLFLISTIVHAQKTVKASEILKEIKAGNPVSFKNITVEGTLDFTFMDDAMEKLPKRKKRSWWGSGNSSNEVKNTIEVAVSFENCTFNEDVLAYIPDEDSGYTFTASFDETALFKDCKFKRKAMFKYSRFESNTDFSGSTFEDDSTFKYARFDNDISFRNVKFVEVSTFKYAQFNRNVSFENAIFEDSAIFKYTKFNDGVSFKNVNFEEDLNIKYMNVSGDFNVTNMKVAYDIDSKYTKINGYGFSKFLLKN